MCLKTAYSYDAEMMKKLCDVMKIGERQYVDNFLDNPRIPDRSKCNQSAEIERAKCIARANGFLSSPSLSPPPA